VGAIVFVAVLWLIKAPELEELWSGAKIKENT
jgi:hypothetical protein